MHINSFKELEVYKISRQLSLDIFNETKKFPVEERYSLTDQIRRSSRSIGGQIAEAWAKRRYRNHFISKLTDADGEQMETIHWCEVAHDCNYITKEIAREWISRCESIGRMLNSMITKADSFCGKIEEK